MADPHPLPPRLLALLADMPLEELAFSAVPVKARRDGWTMERQRGFIARLALGGCVTTAARGVGMTRKSAYRLRDRPDAESFANSWDKAAGWGQDRTVDVALEKALVGERVPIMRDGRCVGERFRVDNRLTFAVLNALDRRAGRRFRGIDPADALRTALAEMERAGKMTPAENKGFSQPT